MVHLIIRVFIISSSLELGMSTESESMMKIKRNRELIKINFATIIEICPSRRNLELNFNQRRIFNREAVFNIDGKLFLAFHETS